jgi:hypothetical protein
MRTPKTPRTEETEAGRDCPSAGFPPSEFDEKKFWIELFSVTLQRSRESVSGTGSQLHRGVTREGRLVHLTLGNGG